MYFYTCLNPFFMWIRIIALYLIIAGLFSCTDPPVPGQTAAVSDTTVVRVTGDYILDDLLKINSASELAEKFGKENVVKDTFWGTEGTFMLCSKIFINTEKEACFLWSDSVKDAGLINVSVVAQYDPDNYKLIHLPLWKTAEGIGIGTTLEELVKINGAEITMYGFGWDYSGMIIGYGNGRLARRPVSLQLGEDYSRVGKLGDDYIKIAGEQELKSSNPVVKKYNPVVVKISVRPVTPGAE
jgi:hypothetical protein